MATDVREYYRAKYQELEDIPGVGPSTANELRKLGYRTIQSLATASIIELVSGGMSEQTAVKAVSEARKAIEIRFVTGAELSEMRKNMKKLTTGCSTLDRLLNGGLETQSITEFYGEFGSGKSQICQQLAVTVQLPEEKGGLGGSSLFIDTEQIFRPERVMQMAELIGLDPQKALKNIVFAEAYSSDHQMILADSADEVIKEHNVKCIIVDSLTGHFRSEYIGRETLAPRQQKLNQHMHRLIKLGRAFNAVIAVTNQVSTTPDLYAGKIVTPIGGNIVGHIAHTRIFLRKGRDNLRIAKIEASPFLPIGETPFRITDRGIEPDEV
jgi:DNA repair protein RadA